LLESARIAADWVLGALFCVSGELGGGGREEAYLDVERGAGLFDDADEAEELGGVSTSLGVE
jgi:hypothetical protein